MCPKPQPRLIHAVAYRRKPQAPRKGDTVTAEIRPEPNAQLARAIEPPYERLRLVTDEDPGRIESPQAIHDPEPRYFDAVGRPRKLASGAMAAIMREYRKGNSTTRELAERYGVSVSLVLTIVYHTPRGSGKKPAPQAKRPVVVQHED